MEQVVRRVLQVRQPIAWQNSTLLKGNLSLRPLRLTVSQVTTTGAILATYVPADSRSR
jgi:hypothetical protein